MLQVANPGFDSVPREVPASMTDRKKGSLVVFFRRVPWVKWREISREQVAAQDMLERYGDLLDAIARERPADHAALQEFNKRGAELFGAFCAAEDRVTAATRAIVSWGVAGHEKFVDLQQRPHPTLLEKVEWLSKEWPLLHGDTLDIYQGVGILQTLAKYVAHFQGNTLPETLDGFFPKPKEGKEE